MKRNHVFALVMAIIWTLVALLVAMYVYYAGTSGPNLILLVFAFIAVAGNWLRYIRMK